MTVWPGNTGTTPCVSYPATPRGGRSCSHVGNPIGEYSLCPPVSPMGLSMVFPRFPVSEHISQVAIIVRIYVVSRVHADAWPHPSWSETKPDRSSCDRGLRPLGNDPQAYRYTHVPTRPDGRSDPGSNTPTKWEARIQPQIGRSLTSFRPYATVQAHLVYTSPAIWARPRRWFDGIKATS